MSEYPDEFEDYIGISSFDYNREKLESEYVKWERMKIKSPMPATQETYDDRWVFIGTLVLLTLILLLWL